MVRRGVAKTTGKRVSGTGMSVMVEPTCAGNNSLFANAHDALNVDEQAKIATANTNRDAELVGGTGNGHEKVEGQTDDHFSPTETP